MARVLWQVIAVLGKRVLRGMRDFCKTVVMSARGIPGAHGRTQLRKRHGAVFLRCAAALLRQTDFENHRGVRYLGRLAARMPAAIGSDSGALPDGIACM
jgi:hypothetical protein